MNAREARRLGLVWLALFALWLLLAAEVSRGEVIAAGLAATLVTALVEVVVLIAPERVSAPVWAWSWDGGCSEEPRSALGWGLL